MWWCKWHCSVCRCSERPFCQLQWGSGQEGLLQAGHSSTVTLGTGTIGITLAATARWPYHCCQRMAGMDHLQSLCSQLPAAPYMLQSTICSLPACIATVYRAWFCF